MNFNTGNISKWHKRSKWCIIDLINLFLPQNFLFKSFCVLHYFELFLELNHSYLFFYIIILKKMLSQLIWNITVMIILCCEHIMVKKINTFMKMYALSNFQDNIELKSIRFTIFSFKQSFWFLCKEYKTTNLFGAKFHKSQQKSQQQFLSFLTHCAISASTTRVIYDTSATCLSWAYSASRGNLKKSLTLGRTSCASCSCRIRPRPPSAAGSESTVPRAVRRRCGW